MTMTQQKNVVLPVGLQCIYFIMIALTCYMMLDAFGVSLTNLVAYKVTLKRMVFSYGGLLILVGTLFFAHSKRYFENNKVLVYSMIALLISALIMSSFNENIFSFRRNFETDTLFFISLHAFMVVSFYGWVTLFVMVYYSAGHNSQSITLVWSLGALLASIIYVVLIWLIIQLVQFLDLNLHSWPLWFKCFVFSFSILCSSNMIALLSFYLEAQKKIYLIVVTLSLFLSLFFVIYLNITQSFESHVVMLYFNYPDFIQ